LAPASSEQIRCWNRGPRVPEGSLDNAAQILAAGGGWPGFMLLEQAQAGTDNLGFIIEASAGNKLIYQPFEMGRYDSAHTVPIFR